MDLPPIVMTMDTSGAMVVRVDFEADYDNALALLGAVPALQEHPAKTAEAVNHLTYGFDYTVITDPDAFRSEYTAKYEAEGDAPFVAGRPQLHDFGRQDLASLDIPTLTSDALVFFAKDQALGIAYRAEMPLDTGVATYKPLATVSE
ncbi:hypothetical protein [Tateyamaria sp. ANG-S1]|uniref:hypothetical protein n=1 Tax=Tateyamaria sp. ANG-S1 TaxID=1577905 RepID=UPI000580A7FB|nr:hypothetical protein [Tateyamaria sp. ANG-S1]KIC47743.1 hypothetical protein RA29_19205 [Tateyamaria sp. ANG-S1]